MSINVDDVLKHSVTISEEVTVINEAKPLNRTHSETQALARDHIGQLSNSLSIEQLDQLHFCDVYRLSADYLLETVSEMFKTKQYVMFVKNQRIVDTQASVECSVFKRYCKYLIVDDLMGSLFLPIEYIETFLAVIHRYNQKLCSLPNVERQNYNVIHFDEHSIKKNTLYKRLDILDKCTFVSLKEYQSKLTEAKIRGLCQLAEELGASKITITFEKNLKNTLLKESTINMEINSIAGSLGLQRSESDTNKENHAYDLSYETINSIQLNEQSLVERIRAHQMITSDKLYQSNLELQYLISSRCRHFISHYNTTFNIDTESVVDKAIEARFKQNGYDLGGSFKNSKTLSNHLKICTEIHFRNIDEYYHIIDGFNVTHDRIGFHHLMLCLNKQGDFAVRGVFIIMNFIEGYVHTVMRHESPSQHERVAKILTLVKENMTLDEYAECLQAYFNLNSTWVQFQYFMDVLQGKTKSYDNLHYLIIYNRYLETGNYHDQIPELLQLIQSKCKANGVEDSFIAMLRPYSQKTYYMMKDLLVTKFKLFKTFNLYGLHSLIAQIARFNPVHVMKVNKGPEGLVQRFLFINDNIRVGLALWEFYSFMVPLIQEVFNQELMAKVKDPNEPEYTIVDKIYFADMFNGMVNFHDFMLANISSIDMLRSYINDCINLIHSGLSLKRTILEGFRTQTDEKAFGNYLVRYMMHDTAHSFYTIKLNIMIQNNYDNLKSFIRRTFSRSLINNDMFDAKDRRHSFLKKTKSFKSMVTPRRQQSVSTEEGDSPLFSDSSDISEENESPLIVSNQEKIVYMFVKSILSYNHRNIDVYHLPLNNIGYSVVMKNYHNGIEAIEFGLLVKPFIKRLAKYILDYNERFDVDLELVITKYDFNYDSFRELRDRNYSYPHLLRNIYEFLETICPEGLVTVPELT